MKRSGNSEYKRVFYPFFLWNLEKAERKLAEAERKGWKISNIKYGCILELKACEPMDNAQYYFIGREQGRFDSYTYHGQQSLEKFVSHYKKKQLLSFKLPGIQPFVFYLYRFDNEQDNILQAKQDRKEKMLRYKIGLAIDRIGDIGVVCVVLTFLVALVVKVMMSF